MARATFQVRRAIAPVSVKCGQSEFQKRFHRKESCLVSAITVAKFMALFFFFKLSDSVCNGTVASYFQHVIVYVHRTTLTHTNLYRKYVPKYAYPLLPHTILGTVKYANAIFVCSHGSCFKMSPPSPTTGSTRNMMRGCWKDTPPTGRVQCEQVNGLSISWEAGRLLTCEEWFCSVHVITGN
jgi:hypothetical protein